MSRWIRIAHLMETPSVQVGYYVSPGKMIGKCGATGHVTGPHVHLDGTKSKPKSWYQYTSRPLVEYFDTFPFASIVMPYPRRFITSRHGQLIGGVVHRGVDINVAPQDLGISVYSPVYGRVQYIEPPTTVYRLIGGIRKLIQPTWGGGFGNFLWIEIDESKY